MWCGFSSLTKPDRQRRSRPRRSGISVEDRSMRPDEPRTFDVDDRMLDPCDAAQVQAWAEFYETSPDAIRQACDAVGGNRTAVELKLAAPQA